MLAAGTLIGHFPPGSLNERLPPLIEEKRAERAKRVADSFVLVVEQCVEISPAFVEEYRIPGAEFTAYIDGFSGTEARQMGRASAERLTTAFLLAANSNTALQRLSESVYAIDDTDRPVYSLSFNSRVSLGVVHQTTPDVVDAYRDSLSHCHRLTGLEAVCELFTAAIAGSGDRLHRFVFAWTGLEIFIKKVFRDYEAAWRLRVAERAASADVAHLDRLRERAANKYTLVEQFSMLAAAIGGAEAPADVEAFSTIKKRRDRFVHRPSAGAELPVEETLDLLRKYLRLHIGC